MVILPFLALAAAVIVTPGPDTALTVRHALAGGRRAGTWTALGVATGQLSWSIATSLGLIAVLLASRPLFEAVRIAGAAYLVLLGVQSLHAAWRGGDVAAASVPTRIGDATAFRQGVLNNLANPKMAVFFASALPPFAPAGPSALPVLLGLGALFAAMTFVWLSLYAATIGRARRWVANGRGVRVFHGTAGAVLVVLGVRVALDRA